VGLQTGACRTLKAASSKPTWCVLLYVCVCVCVCVCGVYQGFLSWNGIFMGYFDSFTSLSHTLSRLCTLTHYAMQEKLKSQEEASRSMATVGELRERVARLTAERTQLSSVLLAWCGRVCVCVCLCVCARARVCVFNSA
jgi:hypothetical protein